MTSCINKTTVLGFLGADPVRREMQAGGSVVTMRVATTEHWKTPAGERRSATEWHSVVIFSEALGKTAMSFLRKGSAVYVEGQIRYKKYIGRDQVERTAAEIVLPKFGGDLRLMDPRQDEAARREPSGRDLAAGDNLGGDEVPF